MVADNIKDRIAAVARQAMELAQSKVVIAVGNTLVVPIPINGIDMSDDMTAFLRFLTQSTGFYASYSESRGLELSWTNISTPKTQSTPITLEDINSVLGEMLAIQAEAAQRQGDWSRTDVLQAVQILIAILFGVLTVISSPSGTSDPGTGGGGTVIQSQQQSTPSTSGTPKNFEPRSNESPDPSSNNPASP